MRIRAAAKAYLEERAAKRSSASLLSQARRSLGRFASHLGEKGVREVRDVQEAHVASFAAELRRSTTPRGTPLRLASQAIYLERLRGFCRFLERRGLLLRNPASELVIPGASPLPRVVLNERAAARLMEAPREDTRAGKRDRAILETLYGMGLRRGECVRLDVADLDLRQGTLLVRDGKGGRDRLLPVPGRAAASLAVYLKDVRPQLVNDPREPALFLTAWGGRRLSDVSVSFLLRYHARKAGVGKVHPHALRHTCATHLLRGGADVRHVQAILGHKKLETTSLYTRVAVKDLREVFARAHPRERSWGGGRSGKMRGDEGAS